ncbi:MAG: nucleoside phosphorylase [Acutalibacter sp.]|jgi:uridine phosphorylase
MLCNEFDPTPKALINPEDHLSPMAGFPEICVMAFSKHIVEQCLERYGGEPIASAKFCTGEVPIYRVEVEGTPIALSLPHVGGPAAAGFIEDVWPLGGKCFVFFGAAGVLDSSIPLNSFILPTAAVRDEGLSYHYLAPSDEVVLDPDCVSACRGALESLGLPYREGKTWTTDAFYRETRKKLKRRKEQGCISVEMECASLAAVAQFRGVKFAQFFYTTDNLDGPVWDSGVLGQQGATIAQESIAVAVETGRRLAAL